MIELFQMNSTTAFISTILSLFNSFTVICLSDVALVVLPDDFSDVALVDVAFQMWLLFSDVALVDVLSHV